MEATVDVTDILLVRLLMLTPKKAWENYSEENYFKLTLSVGKPYLNVAIVVCYQTEDNIKEGSAIHFIYICPSLIFPLATIFSKVLLWEIRKHRYTHKTNIQYWTMCSWNAMLSFEETKENYSSVGVHLEGETGMSYSERLNKWHQFMRLKEETIASAKKAFAEKKENNLLVMTVVNRL